LRTALGHAVEQAEVLQTSYNSSEQELQELRDAALETCRSVEEGEAEDHVWFEDWWMVASLCDE
jgi:hypothetical protein